MADAKKAYYPVQPENEAPPYESYPPMGEYYPPGGEPTPPKAYPEAPPGGYPHTTTSFTPSGTYGGGAGDPSGPSDVTEDHYPLQPEHRSEACPPIEGYWPPIPLPAPPPKAYPKEPSGEDPHNANGLTHTFGGGAGGATTKQSDGYIAIIIAHTDTEVKGFGFTDKTIRRGFIRKVYSILMVQLSFTLGSIAWFVCDKQTSDWVMTKYSVRDLNCLRGSDRCSDCVGLLWGSAQKSAPKLYSVEPLHPRDIVSVGGCFSSIRSC